VISENIFRKICAKNHRIPIVKTHTTLQSVSGNKIPTRGTATLHFSAIEKNLPVIVLPKGVINPEMILGSDLMGFGKSLIDYSNKTLTWFDTVFQLTPGNGCSKISAISQDLLKPQLTTYDLLKTEYKDIFAETSDKA
jgi:hypothetical protein